MSVSFRFSRGRLIIAPVIMRHVYACQPTMALDTGARLTLIAPRIAEELGFEADSLEPAGNVIGATGAAPAALVRIRSVSVLGLEVANVRALCHALPRELGLDGILGLNFLRHFKIVIDNESETVTLTKLRG